MAVAKVRAQARAVFPQKQTSGGPLQIQKEKNNFTQVNYLPNFNRIKSCFKTTR